MILTLNILGGGGVGKSFFIRTTSKWIEKILREAGDDPYKPIVLLLGPTGMAAVLIGNISYLSLFKRENEKYVFSDGTTLQSGLNLRFGTEYNALSSQKREEMRAFFENLQVIIIDEFSMVSADALYDVHKRLQEVFISNDPFGGKSIILVGDLLQLPPVQGTPIYLRPLSKKSHSLWTSDENLWQSFDVVTLDVNYRHGLSQWTCCLNRLRKGEMEPEDIELLESRRLSKFPDLDQSKACHVYYDNVSVNAYNERTMDNMPGDYFTFEAECFFPRGYNMTLKAAGTIDTTPFRKTISLKKNARVMLTFNVNIADGLINGALGSIVDFYFGREGKVQAVIVAFDDPRVGEEHRERYKDYCREWCSENGTPIFKSTLDYHGASMKSSKPHGARCRVTQFPLRPAFASTGHKLQGTTIPKGSDLIAHGYTKRVPKGLYYVMLSRCSSIESLYIDDNFDINKIQCLDSALEETERLDEKSVVSDISKNTYEVFFMNIRSYEKHRLDLKNDFVANRSKYICLAETWIHPGSTPESVLEGQTVYHSSFGRGKGCCILAMEEFARSASVCHEHHQITTLNLEEFQLTVVYLSKDADMDNVVVDIENLLDLSKSQMIVGDFNFVPQEKNVMTRFLETADLIQMISEPTHDMGKTLDHLYISSILKEKISCNVAFKYFSDHAALEIQLSV